MDDFPVALRASIQRISSTKGQIAEIDRERLVRTRLTLVQGDVLLDDLRPSVTAAKELKRSGAWWEWPITVHVNRSVNSLITRRFISS
jgi:hypothetical protein